MKIAVIVSDSAHLINVGGEIVRTVKMFDVPPEMQAYIEKAMKYPQYISISVALEDQQP